MLKSAAGADALQDLAKDWRRVAVAIASWNAGDLSRFRAELPEDQGEDERSECDAVPAK